MELDLSVIETAADTLGPVQAPVMSSYPVATQDVALIVADDGAGGRGGARAGGGRGRGAGDSLLEDAAAVRRLHRRPGRRRAASRWPTRCGSARRTGR